MNRFLIMILLATVTCGAVSAQVDQSTVKKSVIKQYNKGVEYLNAKAYDDAIKSLTAAANRGYNKAQYRLGRCYDDGIGVERSSDEATRWYRKAAEQGDENAKTNLRRLGY